MRVPWFQASVLNPDVRAMESSIACFNKPSGDSDAQSSLKAIALKNYDQEVWAARFSH